MKVSCSVTGSALAMRSETDALFAPKDPKSPWTKPAM